MTNDYVRFVFDNAATMNTALLQCQSLRYAEHNDLLGPKFNDEVTVAFTIPAAVFLLVVLFGVIPLVVQFERRRSFPLEVSLSVPTTITTRIKDVVTLRLGQLQNTLSAEANHLEDDGSDHEAEDEPSLTFSSATVSRMGVRTVQLPSMGVFKVVFKVFAPLALAVGWLLLTRFLADSVVDKLRENAPALVLAKQREVALESLLAHARLATLNDTTLQFDAMAHVAELSASNVLALDRALCRDASDYPELEQRVLLYEDGCMGANAYQSCADLQRGLFAMGVRGALQVASRRVLDLLAQTSSSPQLDISSAWAQVEVVGDQLRFVLSKCAALIAHRDTSTVATFTANYKTVSVLLVLCVVPLYLLWLRPLLRRMSEALLHSSALLLMFPEEIVRVMPRISQAMTRIAKMRA